MRDCREAKNFSQSELARILKTNHSVIGRYERDEMTPSVEVAKKMAQLLDTTVGYLLGEVAEADTFKDPTMLRRLNDIAKFPDEDKNCILYTLDAMINNVKLRGLNVN